MTDAGPAPSALHVATLGPCPTCGRERLIRTEVERRPGALSLRVVRYVDCGQCPTLRIEALPPGDQPAAPPTGVPTD